MIRFGAYRLDRAQGLWRNSDEVRLTPKSLSLLCVLVERAGLILAILAQVATAHFASVETKWQQSLVTGLLLAAASAVIFVWLLRIPVSLLP